MMSMIERTPEEQARICREDIAYHQRELVRSAESLIDDLERVLAALKDDLDEPDEAEKARRFCKAFRKRDVKDHIGGYPRECLGFSTGNIFCHIEGYESNRDWLAELELQIQTR